MKKYKIGIALSGGGTRGFAHLGVLHALKEKGIKPEIISGTSAGAIIGVFIASGKEPEEIFNLMKKKKLNDYTKVHLPIDGLFGLDKLKKTLNEIILQKKIENLEIPLFIAATNMNEGRIEYFNKGPLDKLVIASSSIPVLFSPVSYKNSKYTDGGLLDNLPIKPLVRRCEKIIAVNIHPVIPEKKLDNLLKIAARTFELGVQFNKRYIKSKSVIYIEPKGITKYHILDTKNNEELFELGYKHCKNMNIDL